MDLRVRALYRHGGHIAYDFPAYAQAKWEYSAAILRKCEWERIDLRRCIHGERHALFCHFSAVDVVVAEYKAALSIRPYRDSRRGCIRKLARHFVREIRCHHRKLFTECVQKPMNIPQAIITIAHLAAVTEGA